MVSNKCEHGKRKSRCKECGGSEICEHNKRKSRCKECGGSQICEHNKVRSHCKECGGSQICEHNKARSHCKECGGSQICEHNKQKNRCKECGGSQICEHNKVRSHCKECGGSQICEHNKVRSHCKECGGSEICEHYKRKSQCKECGGSEICEHYKIRSRCKECGGSQICEHNKIRSRCKECGGSEICEHNKRRNQCPDCKGIEICKSQHTFGCRTTGNRKLNGFCSHCFVNLFPDDPRALTVRKKSKELQVATHIFSKYDGFKNDKPFYADLEGGCCATKRRIDLRKLINNTMLCIEVDENQHKYYIKENENNRYDDLFMDFSGKYIFIRYNPDKFIDKYGKSKNPMFNTRMGLLEKAIDKHIQRIVNYENTELVEIHHLFYDEDLWEGFFIILLLNIMMKYWFCYFPMVGFQKP